MYFLLSQLLNFLFKLFSITDSSEALLFTCISNVQQVLSVVMHLSMLCISFGQINICNFAIPNLKLCFVDLTLLNCLFDSIIFNSLFREIVFHHQTLFLSSDILLPFFSQLHIIVSLQFQSSILISYPLLLGLKIILLSFCNCLSSLICLDSLFELLLGSLLIKLELIDSTFHHLKLVELLSFHELSLEFTTR